MNPDIAELLWRDLEIFLLVGALLGVMLGLLLAFRPQLLPGINRVANRWISMRHADRLLDKSIDIDHWCYQHHRMMGILVILGAGYVLVHFGFVFNKESALRSLAGYMPNMLLEGLLDALVIISLLGATVAVLVGLFLWLKPGLLHGVEKEANLWVSSRRATKALNVPHDEVERYVEHHARLVGWLLLMGSAILFTALITLWV